MQYNEDLVCRSLQPQKKYSICINDPDYEYEGDRFCMEVSCEDATAEQLDNLGKTCYDFPDADNKFYVEKVYGEEGNACKLKTLCTYGSGNSDEECIKYTVENAHIYIRNITCLYDSDNNKCSERYFCE